jgi:anti-anti-sigma regulatory factor
MTELNEQNPAKPPAMVRAACFEGVVWIRVESRGNYLSSGPVKKFVLAMINRGHKRFVVDLAACDHMDSTFMGTLAGISQKLGHQEQGLLTVINVRPRNMELLENLGLHLLFRVEALADGEKTPAESGAELMEIPMAENPDKGIVMAAHEALIAANPANAERFQDVLDYLGKDTGASSPS